MFVSKWEFPYLIIIQVKYMSQNAGATITRLVFFFNFVFLEIV